jgi:hypothetical protein
MAKKVNKKIQEKPKFYCRDCVYCKDFYNKNYKGDLFMGKCEITGFSVILDVHFCEKGDKRR